MKLPQFQVLLGDGKGENNECIMQRSIEEGINDLYIEHSGRRKEVDGIKIILLYEGAHWGNIISTKTSLYHVMKTT